MKLLPYAALAALGAAGVGGWYRFGNLKPRTLREYLEWQGLRLISDSESNYWKAVIEENKELVGELKLDASGVKEWCKSHMDSEQYEDIKSSALLLCVDNPKTVKARIIQLDGGTHKLINGDNADKQYKVSYVFRKHIEGFNALIGYSSEVGKDGKVEIDLESASKAFKEWCINSLERAIDEMLVLNIRELCTPKKFSTVKEYLSGKTLLTESGQESELETVHNKIKDFASYKADISEAGKEKLKEWCDKSLKEEFSTSLSVFEETLPKVISRCVKGSQATEQ
ncbi:hypothetical protein HF1_10320 [Mycoplasma haemofelis str. Langford 1]|uniref:Uncharacterized protein n=1 Tax=Mycoplasma haemofelis (strain Langford 1) TaxID=941640 RepID=E8ZIR9_MYCHL|nr:hypothetical protein [Mycoplasma haemofelis]CBY93040.1 hypothetical protein HF1_10320 [Mycoplasma haemofelis str. Langford 1]